MSVVPASKKTRTINVILWVVAILAYAGGVTWRCVDVYCIQSPIKLPITSDMGTYYGAAINWASGGPQNIADLSRPPGPEIYYGILYWLDHSGPGGGHGWATAILVQVILSSAVPLLIWAIGYELYGVRVALLASSITSLYFPIIHYACFILSEPTIIFFIPLSFWLLVRSIRVRRTWLAGLIGFVAGVSLGETLSLKPAVLGPAVLIFLCLLEAAWRNRWSRLWLVVGTSSLGLILFLAPLSVRATKLNEGHFCVLSKNGAHNVLMGHHGHHRLYQFHDRKRGYQLGWGNPADVAAGYSEDVHFEFGPYESDKALAAAWEWIYKNPQFALDLSVQSVGRLFIDHPIVDTPSLALDLRSLSLVPKEKPRDNKPAAIVELPMKDCSTAFPLSQSPAQAWGVAFYNWLYLLLILPPAVIHLVWNWPRLRQLKGPGLGDVMLALPLMGTIVVAFCTLGETRTRIPYDTLMILLAARFYTRGVCRPDGLSTPDSNVEISPASSVAST